MAAIFVLSCLCVLEHMNWILSEDLILFLTFQHFQHDDLVLFREIFVIVTIKCVDWSRSPPPSTLTSPIQAQLAQHIFCSLLDQVVMLENNGEIDDCMRIRIPLDMINNWPSAPLSTHQHVSKCKIRLLLPSHPWADDWFPGLRGQSVRRSLMEPSTWYRVDTVGHTEFNTWYQASSSRDYTGAGE